ncbi:MAG: hypothetical protein IPK64_20620 [bacterium]|nr:hypothetical protein [bacterium]
MAASDIFGKAAAQTYTQYRATLRFKNLIVGGIPSDKSVIEGWIRSRMDLGDAAISELVEQTVTERGVLTPDEAIEAVMQSELAPSVNGFKRDDNGQLCIEGRIVKAALKEWMNSAYPGTKFPGKTKIEGLRKGLMRYAAEAVRVDDMLIGLGVKEPTTIEERIKHVMTPQGPRSSINRVEVVEQPEVTFTISVRDDFIPEDAWARIWSVGEAIGLGSDRGRSDGQFELTEWQRL